MIRQQNKKEAHGLLVFSSLLLAFWRRCGSLGGRSLVIGALDTGGFAGELTHIMDASAANVADFDEFDLRDSRAIDWEDALDANAVGHLPNGEGFAHAMAAALNDDAFVDLDTLLFVFDDTDVDFDGVSA